MGGFFGAVSKDREVVLDVFFGVDYHSHLGTKNAGLAFWDREKGFSREIHDISNAPFRTKFEDELHEFAGNCGIGCISDTDPQPLLVRSHLGLYAIMTLGIINNADDLIRDYFSSHNHQFMAMSSGRVNTTELTAALINEGQSYVEGIKKAQELIKGSMSIVIMTDKGEIIAARDSKGRTPVRIGEREDGYCVSFESFPCYKLGYKDYRELGPGEITKITAEGVEVLSPADGELKICAFLWSYYGYPSSDYEGVNVESMRYRNGEIMARDEVLMGRLPKVDYVCGVPDSGVPHAIGFSNRSGKPYARAFIKYTPTWPRSFMPTIQAKRDLIARMKLIPVHDLIEGRRILLIDDSIVRGTQLRKTVSFLYNCGAKEVHARPASPPILFGCKYLNFSRSTSDLELIARRMIDRIEGRHIENEELGDYLDPDSEKYAQLLEELRKEQGFTSLSYNRLDDMLDAVGIPPENLCTYCWNGKG